MSRLRRRRSYGNKTPKYIDNVAFGSRIYGLRHADGLYDSHVSCSPESLEIVLSNTIFISHSNRDLESALRLAEDLKRAGLAVWLDEWEISVGDPIVQKIQKGISDAAYVAVWLTEASVASGWVGTEWQTKYEEEVTRGSVTVLPLLAEDCELPSFLKGKRYADFRASYATGLASLLNVVGIKDWTGAFWDDI